MNPLRIFLMAVLFATIIVGFSYNGSAGTEHYVIAVQEGSISHTYAAENLPNATVYGFDTIDLAIGALKLGDVDFDLGDLPTLKFYQADSDGLSIAGSFSGENLGIGVAPGESDLLAAINVALGEIIESGEYDTIFAATFGDEIVVLTDDTDENTATAYPAEPTGKLAEVLANEELIFGTDPYYPPFESYDGDTVVGFDADMAAAIGSKIAAAYDQSLNVTMKEKTWDDLLTFAYDDYDATLSAMTKTAQRAEETDFSRAYYSSKQGILASTSSPTITGVDDLNYGIYVNDPPVSKIDSIEPSPAEKGTAVYLNGSTGDTDGTIVSYLWESSIDGELSTEANFSSNGLSLGEHTITFRAQDNDGAWSVKASASLFVGIAPIPKAGIDIKVEPNTEVQFTGSGTDEDGTIVNYEWDLNGDGVYDWSSTLNGITTHIYNSEGTYTAVLRLTDNDGITATDSRTITVGDGGGDEGESSLPSVSMIPALISIGLIAIYRRK